jgi:hypothetical protein
MSLFVPHARHAVSRNLKANQTKKQQQKTENVENSETSIKLYH